VGDEENRRGEVAKDKISIHQEYGECHMLIVEIAKMKTCVAHYDNRKSHRGA
jgi:hypothetical protein